MTAPPGARCRPSVPGAPFYPADGLAIRVSVAPDKSVALMDFLISISDADLSEQTQNK